MLSLLFKIPIWCGLFDPSSLKLEAFQVQVEGMHQFRRLILCGAGHLIRACSLLAPSRASEEPDLSRRIEIVSNNNDFTVSLAALTVSAAAAERAKRQADEAFKQSDEHKIQQAVSMLIKTFQASQVMQTIEERVRTWEQHATIVSGRYQPVAVQKALRCAQGVWKLTVKDWNWEEQLYKSLQIDGLGMLQEVFLRVGAELADLPSPKTKPHNPVGIPRGTTAGWGHDQINVNRPCVFVLLSFSSLNSASLSQAISKSLIASFLKSVISSKSRLGVSSSFLAVASFAIFLKFICCKSAGWMLFVFSAWPCGLSWKYQAFLSKIFLMFLVSIFFCLFPGWIPRKWVFVSISVLRWLLLLSLLYINTLDFYITILCITSQPPFVLVNSLFHILDVRRVIFQSVIFPHLPQPCHFVL